MAGIMAQACKSVALPAETARERLFILHIQSLVPSANEPCAITPVRTTIGTDLSWLRGQSRRQIVPAVTALAADLVHAIRCGSFPGVVLRCR